MSRTAAEQLSILGMIQGIVNTISYMLQLLIALLIMRCCTAMKRFACSWLNAALLSVAMQAWLLEGVVQLSIHKSERLPCSSKVVEQRLPCQVTRLKATLDTAESTSCIEPAQAAPCQLLINAACQLPMHAYHTPMPLIMHSLVQTVSCCAATPDLAWCIIRQPCALKVQLVWQHKPQQ